jgi:hypothetical protein
VNPPKKVSVDIRRAETHKIQKGIAKPTIHFFYCTILQIFLSIIYSLLLLSLIQLISFQPYSYFDYDIRLCDGDAKKFLTKAIQRLSQPPQVNMLKNLVH